MQEQIKQSLLTLAAEQGFRVLFACESGSRAWGFASQDSDWDVRFFFARPEADYLKVHLPDDYIHCDLPGELDLTGWDLRKALHHATKSSASVLEWLGSPTVYFAEADFAEKMRAVVASYFQVRPTVHHYLGLAKQLMSQAGEGRALNGKKYLYVLRATLCAHWALRHRTPPPVLFADLLPLVPDFTLTEAIQHFVKLKQAGNETDAFPVSDALRNFTEALRQQAHADVSLLETAQPSANAADQLFQSTIRSISNHD